MNKKIPDLIREHIKKEHTKGTGVTELSRAFGVSRTAIYAIIKGKVKEPKVEGKPIAEATLISELTGVPIKTATNAYHKCIALDALALRDITPGKVLEAGINIAKSVDTNTILHEQGYALSIYPLAALMATDTGLTHIISWVDVFVLLIRPRAWMQYMIDSGKPFSEWGLFRRTD
jgi:hypothetical protein